jgi:hypothetical protein
MNKFLGASVLLLVACNALADGYKGGNGGGGNGYTLPPKGYFDSINLHGRTTALATATYYGWACNPSNKSYQGRVEFWRDNHIFLGAVPTNKIREAAVGGQCMGNRAHGFSDTLYVGNELIDNQVHNVHAYFVLENGTKVQLQLSPRAVLFSRAPACPASQAVGLPGIGDGCTTKCLESIPNIGQFRDAFTPACNYHDKCYTTLGTSYGECDGNFKTQMQEACGELASMPRALREHPMGLLPDPLGLLPDDPPPPPGLGRLPNPALYGVCLETASQYHAAVAVFGRVAKPLYSMQMNALRRSRELENSIAGGECTPTTPEALTLYSDRLVTRVNDFYRYYRGRNATTKELIHAVNQGGYDWGNIVSNYAGWEARMPAVALEGKVTTPVTPNPRLNY